MDPAREQRGERRWQPRGHHGGVVHLLGRRQRGQVQLGGQLVGGELILQAAAGMPGGELGHGRHLRPGIAGFLPPRRGEDPHQLVI